MDYEIIPADPKYKRKVVVVLFAAAGLGALVLYYFSGILLPKVAELPVDKAIALTAPWLYAMALSPLLIAAYMLYYAVIIFRGKRFPPSGAKVIKDTKVLEGKLAIVRSYMLMFLAGLIIVSSVIAVFMVKALLSSFLQ